MTTTIEITDPTLCNWISELPGDDNAVHKHIETTLNIGRLCLEQCRLNPNLDLIQQPLETFAEKIQDYIDNNISHITEKGEIYNNNLQTEIKMLRETLNDLMAVKGSSNRKGKMIENLEKEILERNFPNYIVHDMSNVEHESDIHLETPFGKVLVELKTYTTNVNSEQIKKFYRDVDRVGCPYALFVSNTSGIVGKKKFEWEYYGVRKTVCVFVANGGVNAEGLILGLNFLDCFQQILGNKTYNIESHISSLVACIEKAQSQIEQVSRVRGDIKLLKEYIIKKSDEIAEGIYNIEFNLKVALNQVVEETRALSYTDLKQYPIDQLEIILKERGDRSLQFIELDRLISAKYPDRFTYSIGTKDNEIFVVDKANNSILATIKKLKTKREYDVVVPINLSDSFTFNPKIETITKNTVSMTLDNTGLVGQRIIEFLSN
jgi:hypothetical protein